MCCISELGLTEQCALGSMYNMSLKLCNISEALADVPINSPALINADFQHSAQLFFCPIVYGAPAFSTLSLIISLTPACIHLSVAARVLTDTTDCDLEMRANGTDVGSALSAVIFIVFVDAR